MTRKSYTCNDEQDGVSVPLCCSSRFSLALVSLLGGVSLYLMRINMTVAIVCMTRDPWENLTQNTTNVFENTEDLSEIDLIAMSDEFYNTDLPSEGEFSWSRQLRGMVSSSFFVGYILTQVIGGWLATRYGSKWVLATGMLLTITATLLSPSAARASVYLLMLMRMLKGMGSGVYFPSLNQMWAVWAPFYERSFLMAFVYSGNSIGSVLSFFLSGFLCASIGWEWIFYLYALVACVWFIMWVVFAFDSPSDHPRISKEEEEYLEASIEAKPHKHEALEIPWAQILTSKCVWANIVADFCHAWGSYTALTSIAQYMKDVLKFDIGQNGLFNSLPYVCQWIGTITFSIVVDYARSTGRISTTNARKIGASIACFPPATLIIALSFLDQNKQTAAVIILCLVELCASANRVSILPNKVDIAPRYAGVIMGIGNTAATLPGIIAPIIVGRITEMGTRVEWQRVFILSASMYAIGGLMFAIFGSGEVQPWARKANDEGSQPKRRSSNQIT